MQLFATLLLTANLAVYALAAPIADTTAPIPSTSATIHSTSAPIPSTTEPIASTSASIPTTTASIANTSAPIPTTSASIANTSASIPTTSASIANTSAPIPTTSASIANTSAPIPSTTAHINCTDGPMASTSVPIASTSASIANTSAPIPSTSASIPSTSAPIPSQTGLIANKTKGMSSSCDSDFHCGTQTGQGTFYAPDLGACGIQSTPEQLIVAVSWKLYDSYPGYKAGNPNTNPVCGRKINASYKGKSVTVTVVDRCTGCDETSLDFSPAAFNQLADQSLGRLYNMTWTWAS